MRYLHKMMKSVFNFGRDATLKCIETPHVDVRSWISSSWQHHAANKSSTSVPPKHVSLSLRNISKDLLCVWCVLGRENFSPPPLRVLDPCSAFCPKSTRCGGACRRPAVIISLIHR